MTIAELIEKLKQYPQDLEVVTTGYESGRTSKLKITTERLCRDTNLGTWYYGEHSVAADEDRGPDIFHALCIGR